MPFFDFIQKCLRLRPAPSKCLSERINWIISTIPDMISKILFVNGSYEFLAMLEGNIREAPFFFKVQSGKITVWPTFNYGLEIPFHSIIIIKGCPLCVHIVIFFLLHLFSRRTVFSTDPFKNKISGIAFEIFIYKIFSKLLMLLRTIEYCWLEI